MENNNKRPSLWAKAMSKKKVIAACFSSFLILALAFGFFAYKNAVYEVFIDGKSVGYVKDYDTFKTALDALTVTDGENVAENVTAKRKVVFNSIASENQTSQNNSENETASSDGNNDYQVAAAAIVDGLDASTEAASSADADASAQKQYICGETIESLARNTLSLKQPAKAISVDGNQLAVVPDQDTVDKVIEGIKAYYTPDNASTEVLSVDIREDVQSTDVYEYVENMVDCDSAVQKIISGVETPETYTIQQGDTLWDISNTKGISLDVIQSQNPELNIDKIGIGDVINLSTVQPYVNVEVVANITSQETIAYDTEKVNDSTLLKGKTQVKQAGKNGSKDVVIKTTKVNGVTTGEEVVSSTVTAEPVKEIISVGTKVVKTTSSRGTSSSSSSSASSSGSSSGGFIRPASGIITSNYGYRSRGFHTGVDFANSTGTSIAASKSGTVTFAGWKGGYGYCVIIDHGNGFSTLYGHNSKLKVSVGQHVSQGQTIALMGSTGNSTGSHCHFEIRINGQHVNPWKYL